MDLDNVLGVDVVLGVYPVMIVRDGSSARWLILVIMSETSALTRLC